MIDWSKLGQDYERDAVVLAAELQKVRETQNENLKTILDLSEALADMFFVASCFDAYCQDVPDTLRASIDQMILKARQAYVGKKERKENVGHR